MTKLLKTGAIILLGGALVISGCGKKDANEPMPDSVIAAVPTDTPTITPTPTPIKAIEESTVAEENFDGSMSEGLVDEMDSEVEDDWIQDDGDTEEETVLAESYDVGIVVDTESTDQGAEGNTATSLEIADVYSEPGGDPDTIIGSIDANETVTVQGNVDGWFVIDFDGTRAYVNSELFG